VAVASVAPASPAARVGVAPRDLLLALDGAPVRDELDLAFYGAADRLVLRYLPHGARRARNVAVEKEPGQDLGIEIVSPPPRCCRNRCIFCFIHQNPKGLRAPLYVKDEDLRLSFAHGHYITATSFDASDEARILEQRLTPLYVSVHATDPDVRARMLGLRGAGASGRGGSEKGAVRQAVPYKADASARGGLEKAAVRQAAPCGADARARADILPLLKRLARKRIAFHTQIVLCPGWNDGAQLDRTLDDLESLGAALLSVAIVPVGLTAHRAGLEPLRPVTPELAREVIAQAAPRQRRLRAVRGERTVLLADEFYLLAGRATPRYTADERTCQIENGVGMIDDFLVGWSAAARRLPPRLARPLRVAVLTGLLGARVLEPIALALASRLPNLRLEVEAIENSLYGPSVTVSGLLPGRDFARALDAAVARGAQLVLLPANALRRGDDERFLDDVTLDDLRRRHPRVRIEIVDGRARDLARSIVDAALIDAALIDASIIDAAIVQSRRDDRQ
jgi:NifB/MoaA-like Fe-S oxidoreductase